MDKAEGASGAGEAIEVEDIGENSEAQKLTGALVIYGHP